MKLSKNCFKCITLIIFVILINSTIYGQGDGTTCEVAGLMASSCNLSTLEYYFTQDRFISTDFLNLPFGAKLYFSGDVVFNYPVNFNCQPTQKREMTRFVYEVDCLQVYSNKSITYNAEEIYASVDFSTIYDIDTSVDKPVDMIESYSRFMKPANGVFGDPNVFEPVIYARIKPQVGYKCDFNPGFRQSRRNQDKYALHSKCAWGKTLFAQGDFNIRISPCDLQNNTESIRKLEEIGFDKNFYIEKLNFTPTDGLFYTGKKESIYIRYYPNFEKKFDLTSIQDIFDSYLYIINYCEDNPNKIEISFGMQNDLWDHQPFNITDYIVTKNTNSTFEGSASSLKSGVVLILISILLSLIF
ncbi:hypothetical protein DICPUDRAFT_92185 [Dictyostelium purpureum]|uniref:Uncharacterized protein n=1 Tax=Dictyostelium purpureum TaxID=5786 RepID=F0ZN84_DICPU|nr:uncharacterized protein DICPUDRAFT_92185 [Dictyostelium purpureum]EGC34605.1 hypothetical protein DICPUDRAFT_92185 [Dictyostelium purpureum]|eukprot:XP_003288882.1 hypothetical protein DICPUDRAFT_92185 [Dictyostelium purpureum]